MDPEVKMVLSHFLNKDHASLVSERFIASDTLVKKVFKTECDTCPILKLEYENLKGQLARAIFLSIIVSTSSSER